MHKQGRRHEVGPSMCPPVENPDLVFQKTGDCQSPTHSTRLNVVADKLSRLGHPNIVVSPSRDLPINMQQVTPPDSVAPVVIPALAPTLDKSLKSDRSLCPVGALRYYLDRTSHLRQNKELVFGFDKDISPATISSWIKQTVILCHELSNQCCASFGRFIFFPYGTELIPLFPT